MIAAFDTVAGRFQYRVAGIATQDGHVLVHRFPEDDFWALPGGRAGIMELSAETLAREIFEETGLRVSVGRLVWVVENFFVYQGAQVHEIGFYFEMALSPGATVPESRSFLGQEGGKSLQFRWVPFEELRRLRIQPDFLRDRLGSLPATTEHLVCVDPAVRPQ
jgi:8-oxo-dGTP pyrophosphatase MutT (NUDIX family)